MAYLAARRLSGLKTRKLKHGSLIRAQKDIKSLPGGRCLVDFRTNRADNGQFGSWSLATVCQRSDKEESAAMQDTGVPSAYEGYVPAIQV